MLKIGVYGATGYTGVELIQILSQHPQAEITFATSQSFAGQQLNQIYPAAPPLNLIAPEQADPSAIDCAILCLPHAASAPTAVQALEAGARVIDLSADFRLTDSDVYAEWYKIEHPAPGLLDEAVYGLSEFTRPALPTAQLVANPGCYPISILLGLYPAIQAGVIEPGATVIADSKSGASGAGRKSKSHLQFVELSNNFSAYNLGRQHRHLPEMEQIIQQWSPVATPRLIFSPHLLPVPRGILSTIYIPLSGGWEDITRLQALYTNQYDEEPFVQVLPPNTPISLAHAVYTNRCVISLTLAAGPHPTLIVASVIDNLVKGAAGQAVQNMNLMFGFDETTALTGWKGV